MPDQNTLDMRDVGELITTAKQSAHYKKGSS